MMKKALGKGLGAFIPEEFGILKDERYAEIEIERLRPNPAQPRTQFDEATIEELAQSIRESGIVQPILAVPDGDAFKIIVGERRWRAARLAGLRRVPVLVRSIAEDKQLEISLIENLHRENLNPLEVARAYQRLIQELGYTQQQLAEKVGMDRSSVANTLRLLKLPEDIREALEQGRISMGHARSILALDDPGVQEEAFRKIMDQNLSVRNTEKLVNRLKERAPRIQKPLEDPDLHALQEDMVKSLGTKVLISGNRNKGAVKIYFYSMDDLNAIFSRIKGEFS